MFAFNANDKQKSAIFAALIFGLAAVSSYLYGYTSTSERQVKKQKAGAVTRATSKNLLAEIKSRLVDLENYEKLISICSFVLVVIDGDDTQFLDHFVQDGINGGQDAARALRTAVLQHVQGLLPDQPEIKVFIQVYANLEGLSRTYNQTKILPDTTTFFKFVQGFNKSHTYCEFIDAGNDKEAADTKIKGRIDLFHRNAHCKHIVLCASGDNSYTFYLRQLASEHSISHISLIQSKPFPQGLSELATKFTVASFEDVFRKTSLSDRRNAATGTDSNQNQKATTISSSSSNQPHSSDQAFVVSTNNDEADPTSTGGNEPDRSLVACVRLNSAGHRIDSEVRFEEDVLHGIKQRGLCHYHFLTRCDVLECKFSHDGILTPAEINALRFLARTIPCKNIKCRDPGCVAGHQCIRNRHCRKGNACAFPRKMHKVDTKVVNEITVKLEEHQSQPN